MKRTFKNFQQKLMFQYTSYLCLLLLGVILTSCGVPRKEASPAAPGELDYTRDISGLYRLDRIEEITGKDPLYGGDFKLIVERKEKGYHFSVIHRNREIGSFDQPFLNHQFRGRMETAESAIRISRNGDNSLLCQIEADNGAYLFNVYVKK